MKELEKILNDILKSPVETEVIEFKKAQNGFDTQKLGEYFSALSNEANLRNKNFAWLVFGINDTNHSVVGTNYKNTPSALN